MDVELNLERWTNDNGATKDYRVYLDSSGTIPVIVIGVRGSSQANDSVAYWLKLTLNRVDQLVQKDYQIPAVPPTISLTEALDVVLFESPHEAEVLCALYGVYQCKGSEPVRAWIIETSGFPPVMASRSNEGYRRWNSVVNAVTGELIYTASIPCALSPIVPGDE